MGTPLTGPEATEWQNLLAPAEPARRNALMALFRAAPAAGHGLRYSELVAAYTTGGIEDAEISLGTVAGMRAHDTRYVVRLYEAAQRMPDTSNAPVMTTRVTTAVAAAIARGDTAAQVAGVITRTVDTAETDAADVEGKSAFCYALFKLKIDSSKLGKVAASGVAPEDSEYVFSEKGIEVVTSEWKYHLVSRTMWLEYIRKVKRRARHYSRYGLARRIDEWSDWLDEDDDWSLVKALIEEWFDHYEGLLPQASDSELYLRVRRRHGRENPPPAALKEPTGALALPTAAPMERLPAPTLPPVAAPGSEPCLPDLTAAIQQLTSRFNAQLEKLAADFRAHHLTKPARPAKVTAAPADDAPADTAASKKQLSEKRLKRYLDYKERVAALRSAAEATAGQAPSQPATPEPPPGPPEPSPPTQVGTPAAARGQPKSKKPAGGPTDRNLSAPAAAATGARKRRKRVRSSEGSEPPPGPPPPTPPEDPVPADTRQAAPGKEAQAPASAAAEPPSPPSVSPPPELAECEAHGEHARAPAEAPQSCGPNAPGAAPLQQAAPAAAPTVSWAAKASILRPPNDPRPLPAVPVRPGRGAVPRRR